MAARAIASASVSAVAGAFGQMRGGDARDGLVPFIAPAPRLAGGK
jgi:hypothetical protein